MTVAELAAPNAAQPSALVRRSGADTAVFGDAAPAVTLNITPFHVTSGDLNDDDRPDLIAFGVTASGAPAIATSLGQAGGGFAAPPAPYVLPGTANTFLLGPLVAADFNGDGRADVAARLIRDSAGAPPANSGTFVLIANTNGTLQSPVRIDDVTKQGPVVAGDFNGDSRADLAVADTGQFFADTANSVRVYRGERERHVCGCDDDDSGDPLSVARRGRHERGRPRRSRRRRQRHRARREALRSRRPSERYVRRAEHTRDPRRLLRGARVDRDRRPHGGRSRRRDHGPQPLRDRGCRRGRRNIARRSRVTIAPQIGYVQAADLNQDGGADVVAAIQELGLVPLVRTDQSIPADATGPPPAPDFGVSASSTMLTAAAGQSTQTTITVTPQNGFSGQVAFSCSGLPRSATCSFAPRASRRRAGRRAAR